MSVTKGYDSVTKRYEKRYEAFPKPFIYWDSIDLGKVNC